MLKNKKLVLITVIIISIVAILSTIAVSLLLRKEMSKVELKKPLMVLGSNESTIWQLEYEYDLDTEKNIITLKKYIGSDTELTVPGTAIINGTTYTTALKQTKSGNTIWDKKIEKLSFEEGIILPENCSYMFADCSGLKELDVSKFDTSNVTEMNYMFSNCENLASLDVSKFDTNKVTSMISMFSNCNFTELDVSKFVTTNVTNMSTMFAGCRKLTKLDVSKFDTSNVTDMNGMFAYCTSLTEIDVSKFDTSKVTNIYSMFYGCASLAEIDVSKFDTSKVTNIYRMFHGCTSLTKLDVSKFDTSKVTDMIGMFYGCKNLTEIDVSKFDTSNVTDMRLMFADCEKLKEVDLSSFDLGKTEETKTYSIFNNCNSLQTIKAPLNIPNGIVHPLNGEYEILDDEGNVVGKTTILPQGLTETVTLRKVYIGTETTYTIKFVNYDDTELQSDELEAGTMPEYRGETPTRPADDQFTYTFADWDDILRPVTGDKTYKAEYYREPISNTVTLTYLNDDGTEIYVEEYDPAGNPFYYGPILGFTLISRPPIDGKYYTFAGWDKPFPENVTEDITFTATWMEDSEINFYFGLTQYVTGQRADIWSTNNKRDDWHLEFKFYDSNGYTIRPMGTSYQKTFIDNLTVEPVEPGWIELVEGDGEPYYRILKEGETTIRFTLNYHGRDYMFEGVETFFNWDEVFSLPNGQYEQYGYMAAVIPTVNDSNVNINANENTELCIRMQEKYTGIPLPGMDEGANQAAREAKAVYPEGYNVRNYYEYQWAIEDETIARIETLEVDNSQDSDWNILGSKVKVIPLKAGETDVRCTITTHGEQEPVVKTIHLNVTEDDYFVKFINLTEEEKGEVKYLSYIQPNTSMDAFIREHIDTKGSIEICNGTEPIGENDKIGTGYELKITKGTETRRYILVVKGDSTGDGQADFSDILKINKHRLGKASLEGAYLKAGDVTGDEKADFSDILRINKFRLGKINEL